ncbi:MAG: DNA polymerase I [Planctomycetales bacterium]
MNDVLYIVDVFSLVFQVYHAIPPMTGPSGQPTNAIFGFTRDLKYLIEQKRPTHLVCAMDSPGPGVRSEMFAEYKANRSEMPADLAPQLPVIRQMMQGFGLPVIECPGWEADDVIATLARRAVEAGYEVRIVTNDKDARQLIGPRVQLYNVRKDSFLDEAGLRAEWGVRPDQVVDFQALVGDSVDNVPGVPLVGPKKAQALLEKFGTLDEVLAHADEAPGKKLAENLKLYAEQARLSRELVRLNVDLPLECELRTACVSAPDCAALVELFRACGFRTFLKEMEERAPAAAMPAPLERRWNVVDTPDKFKPFLAELRKQPRFCVDLETTALDAVRADIVGWAIAWEAGHGWYLPVQCPPGQPCLDAAAVLDAFRPLLEDPRIEKVNQNIKYDMLVLRRAGVKLEGIGVDPMVGDYLLDAGARSHGLDAIAQKYLGHKPIPIGDLIGKGKQQKQMFEVDVDRAAEYAAEDADLALRLADRVGAELKREGLWDLYWDLERPLIPVLADMEFAGIKVDVEELRRQSGALTLRIDERIGEIHALAGYEFNIGSPVQLRVILFEELELPVLKRTKTGPSTDADVLERLALSHPLPAKIIEHRQLTKLKGTYLDALPLLVNPETGRIHASFNQVVAATGRLSSSDPNLQNIPIRTEEGRRMRKAFVPGEPGWKLVCADYSQIELRMLAHFSRDPELLAAFEQGADIHTAVAADIFDVPAEQVDSTMRRVAKAVNFGVIYGQSPFGLAAALGIPQDEAAAFIENYFDRYSTVASYLEEILRECAETGYVRTILGRRRQITGIRSISPLPFEGRGQGEGARLQRNMSERTAVNTVFQGSAADLIKKAMINVHARLAREEHPGRMLLQIHDELVFESPADAVPALIQLAREEMENALELSVPLVVDVSVGDNWLEIERV